MVNLNESPDLMKILARGDFEALHYVDTSRDGWVIAECPQLQQSGLTSIAAFCMVGLPDSTGLTTTNAKAKNGTSVNLPTFESDVLKKDSDGEWKLEAHSAWRASQ